MGKEQGERIICSCPLCKAMEAARHSEAAKHMRGIERQVLLAARGLIDWCVERLEKEESDKPSKKIEVK